VSQFVPSRRYNFVRSRQLDGTFPGEPSTGVWPITGFRIYRGWGSPPEEAWPYDGRASAWPPAEPPGIDSIAKKFRIGYYKRVRTVSECEQIVANGEPVLVSVEINQHWISPLGGRIPEPSSKDVALANHVVSLDTYDSSMGMFRFWNSWGDQWGDNGYGYLSGTTLDAILWEAWRMFPPVQPEQSPYPADPEVRGWGATDRHDGSVLRCLEFVNANDDRMAWAFAIERQGSLDIEELFVRPQFRRTGYGSKLIRTLHGFAAKENRRFRMWISYADVRPENLRVVEKMTKPLGIRLEPAGMRWSPMVRLSTDDSTHLTGRGPFDPDRPTAMSPELLKSIAGALTLAASSSLTTLIYQAVRGWIDSRNGRRIKFRTGDLELETTQLSQEEFLKLLAVLRDMKDTEKLLHSGFPTKELG